MQRKGSGAIRWLDAQAWALKVDLGASLLRLFAFQYRLAPVFA